MNIFTKLMRIKRTFTTLRKEYDSNLVEEYNRNLSEQVSDPLRLLTKDFPPLITLNVHEPEITFEVEKRSLCDGEVYYVPFSFREEEGQIILNTCPFEVQEEAYKVLELLTHDD